MSNNVKQIATGEQPRTGAANCDAYFGMRMPRATFDTLHTVAAADHRTASKYALGVIQRHLAAVVAGEGSSR